MDTLADGRRVAYLSPTAELIVHNLVSGESYSPLSEFGTRGGFTWTDATHLVGLVSGGTDADGWAWEPDTAPKLVDYWTYADGFDLWVRLRLSASPWELSSRTSATRWCACAASSQARSVSGCEVNLQHQAPDLGYRTAGVRGPRGSDVVPSA